jgi:tRNA pseudouridine55 synthase
VTVVEQPAMPPADSRTSGPPPRCGILLIDKSAGITSHDVVDVVRRRFREKAAGHLGTLDPGASGLLALALGPATRCIQVWQGGEKTYEGTVRFGIVTSTQDLAGEVVEQHPVTVTEDQVRQASIALTGEQLQVPPMVSAIRVRGERLYRLARRGITVERTPRPVHVASWEWMSFALPDATFRVRCSGGTYVRTLAHDLGARLGCGGALKSLRRLRSEPFDLSHAATLRDLHEQTPDQVWAQAGIPLDQALAVLPAVRLTPAEVESLGFGRAVPVSPDRLAGVPRAAGPRSVAFRDPLGHVLALGEIGPGSGKAPGEWSNEGGAEDHTLYVRPHVVFPWAVRQGRGPVA